METGTVQEVRTLSEAASGDKVISLLIIHISQILYIFLEVFKRLNYKVYSKKQIKILKI